MKYGIITKSIADLRARPEFNSERKSQLLYNEPVKIDKNRNGYSRIIQPDGYYGWVNENAIQIISGAKLKKYQESLNFRVKSKTANIQLTKKTKANIPEFLFYGTNLASVKIEGNYCIVKNTDSDKFKIAKRSLMLISKSKTIKPLDIIKIAKKFIGVPYLWGGISTFGFDCSGFVRTVFRTYGIELPRDSRDQYKFGQKVSHENVKPADLLFFKGHVAIALGKDRFIHASLGEGGVAINSLDPKNNIFRKDLHETYLGIRRVLP